MHYIAVVIDWRIQVGIARRSAIGVARCF